MSRELNKWKINQLVFPNLELITVGIMLRVLKLADLKHCMFAVALFLH